MSADYTPSMHNYKNMGHFKIWCQKVLPLVYDDSLSYYEVLCKVIQYINDTTDNVDGLYEDMQDLYSAYNLLQTYVNNYFDNLNVQTEINNKLDAMVLDGTMDELLSPIVGRQIGGVVAEQIDDVVGTQIGAVVANQLPAEVTAQLPDIAAQAASTEVGSWLETHIDPDTGYVIDDTLTVSDAAADAKTVGDKVTAIKSALSDLMTVIENVAFESFTSRQTEQPTTTFNGFASRYSYNGTFKKVIVYGAYSGDSSTSQVTFSIYDDTFTNIIATKTLTVSHTPQYHGVTVEFDSPITMNGNFYIAVLSDGYFKCKNVRSAYCTADASYSNKFSRVSPSGWNSMASGNEKDYSLDIILYSYSEELLTKPTNVIYIGSDYYCDYATVQEALNTIADDSASKQYVFYIMPGEYDSFSMYYTDASRTVPFGRVRYISLIGLDKTKTIFKNNKGNYRLSPCEIWTNGVIKDISFITKTDNDNYDPYSGYNYAYAVHSDFGTCVTEYDNCYFYSNAGPSVGIGTWHNEYLTFKNCTFENDTDGTYGASSLGAFYCHTQTTAPDNDRTNQNLTVENCVGKMNNKPIGMKLSKISGYTGGTFFYTFVNSGFFGKSSGHMVPYADITDPDNELLTEMCFNNVPSTLNTVS